MPPKINKDECVGCGACIEACAHKAIEMADDKAQLVGGKCKDAWACVDVCPTGAITKP